jgi:diazepam-binding inhibitor (GABA receptor modulator, acyl-CoA-binding protein)
VKECKGSPTNEAKLELYGLFKQATSGDNDSSQPWAVQLEARAKWDAWTANKGMTQDAAKEAYIAAAEAFCKKYADA